MASIFEVLCVHADAAYAEQAARAAFDLLDRLEQEQSRFIANSDISRINDLVAGESTRVSPQTMECLVIARHLYDLTDRTFDVSIGSGWERLDLAPDAFSVRVLEGGARLDLGGIGKGFAVDRMAEMLVEWDIPHALVHGGFSSVRALEAPPDQEGWALRLAAPGHGSVAGRVWARHKAFGASGLQKGAHIQDPRTGQPVEGRQAAWVAVDARGEPGNGLSPAALADGLSTAFMILSAAEVRAVCARHPELQAWFSDAE
jgi:thiamine biosynthesis lipoprotein